MALHDDRTSTEVRWWVIAAGFFIFGLIELYVQAYTSAAHEVARSGGKAVPLMLVAEHYGSAFRSLATLLITSATALATISACFLVSAAIFGVSRLRETWRTVTFRWVLIRTSLAIGALYALSVYGQMYLIETMLR